MIDDLESRIRHSQPPEDGLAGEQTAVDTEDLLGKVRAGARRRRTRAGALRGVAAVVLVAAGAVGWSQVDRLDHGDGAPAAAPRTPRTQHSTPIDIGFTPLSLTATGTDNRWVLGTTGCGASRCLFIRHLNRVGTVTDIATPPSKVAVAGMTPDTVDQLRFAGTGGPNGWAFGGALWSTHDYGKTWQRPALPVGGQVTALEAWGGDVYASVKHGHQATLIRSAVNSDDWSTVDTGTTFAQITSIGVSQDIVAVAGVDPLQRAVVLTMTASSPWSRTTACRSATSARVSTAQDALWLLCRHGSRASAVVSTDAARTFAAVQGSFSWNTQLVGRTTQTAIAAGSDGVQEVSVSTAPQPILDVPGFETGGADVTYAGFTNPDYGYLLSVDGTLVRTTDGGRTWSTISLRN